MILLHFLRFMFVSIFIFREANGFQMISSRRPSSPYGVTVTDKDVNPGKKIARDLKYDQVEPNSVRREEIELHFDHKPKTSGNVEAMVIAEFDEDEMSMPDLLHKPIDPNEDQIPVLMATTDKRKKSRRKKSPPKGIKSAVKPRVYEQKETDLRLKMLQSMAPFYGYRNLRSYARAQSLPDPYPPAPSYLPALPILPAPPALPALPVLPVHPVLSTPPTASYPPSPPHASPLYAQHPPTAYLSPSHIDHSEPRLNDSRLSPNPSASPFVATLVAPHVSTSTLVSKLNKLNDSTRIPVLLVAPKKRNKYYQIITPRILTGVTEKSPVYPTIPQSDRNKPCALLINSYPTPPTTSIHPLFNGAHYKPLLTANNGDNDAASTQYSPQPSLMKQRYLRRAFFYF